MIGLNGVNNLQRKNCFANVLEVLGDILETLFHIVDVEYSWISALQEKEDNEPQFKDYQSIKKVKALSDSYRRELEEFLQIWSGDLEYKILKASWTENIYIRRSVTTCNCA